MRCLQVSASEADALLVRRAVRGDRAAFARLVDRYRNLVWQVLARRTNCSDEVEDLVQEVFCWALESLPGLHQPDRFGPWLMCLAENQSISWWHRYTRARKKALELSREPRRRVLWPDEEYAQREVQARVRRAVAALPPVYRQVIVLHCLEGYPCPEIARVLGVGLASATRRLRLGRRGLLQLLLWLATVGVEKWA